MRRIFSRRALVLVGMAICVALVASPALAQGNGKGGGKPKDDGGGEEDPAPPLPNVRYELVTTQNVAPDSWHWTNDVNNLGEIVGWTQVRDPDTGLPGPRQAVLRDLISNKMVFLGHIADDSILPDGFWLASAVGINDHGIVVGYALDASDRRLPYAVDLGFDNPVVDLLPRVGEKFDMAVRVNSRGEIVGTYADEDTRDADGVASVFAWYLDLGTLYGGPDKRMRDVDQYGNPYALDMSGDLPVLLKDIIGPVMNVVELSDPTDGEPTYLAGQTQYVDRVPWRLEIGSTEPEFFTDVPANSAVYGVDFSGAVVGSGQVPLKGNKTEQINWRKTGSEPYESLPLEGYPRGAGGVGQVVFTGSDSRGAVYRVWDNELEPRVVRLDDLVTGTDEALLKWFGYSIQVLRVSSGGVIAGHLPDSNERFVLFEYTFVP